MLLFVHILYKLSSKSKSGPVVPTTIIGCPDKNANSMPVRAVEISVSDIPIRLEVLSATRPPKVIAEERAAKYIKMAAAKHCPFSPSLMSDQ